MAETRAGEAVLQIWLFPRSGGQRGSFPGALASGRPQAGHCSQNPIPEAPPELGLQPIAWPPSPSPLPPLSLSYFQDSGGAILLPGETGKIGEGMRDS